MWISYIYDYVDFWSRVALRVQDRAMQQGDLRYYFDCSSHAGDSDWWWSRISRFGVNILNVGFQPVGVQSDGDESLTACSESTVICSEYKVQVSGDNGRGFVTVQHVIPHQFSGSVNERYTMGIWWISVKRKLSTSAPKLPEHCRILTDLTDRWKTKIRNAS